jgi:hypothetical protein
VEADGVLIVFFFASGFPLDWMSSFLEHSGSSVVSWGGCEHGLDCVGLGLEGGCFLLFSFFLSFFFLRDTINMLEHGHAPGCLETSKISVGRTPSR